MKIRFLITRFLLNLDHHKLKFEDGKYVFEGAVGGNVVENIETMVRVARFLRKNVVGNFNGHKLSAKPTDRVEGVKEHWELISTLSGYMMSHIPK